MNLEAVTCPGCQRQAALVISEQQAICGSDDCAVVTFNPSKPLGGALEPIGFVDLAFVEPVVREPLTSDDEVIPAWARALAERERRREDEIEDEIAAQDPREVQARLDEILRTHYPGHRRQGDET